jgi:3-phenylpropionate/cinnamic acid dioxygenase small subunit
MADRGAIEQLFSQYAAAIDNQEWELLDAIFLDDAVWRMESPGGEAIDQRGLRAIKEFLPGSRADGQTRHIFTNLYVLDEDGDSASVTMYMTFAVTDQGEFNVVMTSVYTADVVHTPSGWRFRRFSLTPDRPYWENA